MANTIPYPTFNWKATDQIRAWDLFQAKAELWLAGEEIKEEIQYTKIVLMLGDEGLSRWSKFDMGADARKIPKDVFAKFKESLGKDISFRTARATLYSSFRQQKGETAAELDLRLSKLVDECKFPTDPTNVKDFLKRDIYINALNYYEVKKWAAKEQEADLTYTKVMDKCKEYEATVRDYVAMANDNSQLQTAYQQGTASLDHNSLKKQKFTGRGRRNRSNSGSRERRPQNKPNGTKCKRCGFERHTTTDGSCPALK